MYCGYCGKELESESTLICRECGARAGNDINYCTNCGGIRKKKKKKFCEFCGHMYKTVQSNNRGYIRSGFNDNRSYSRNRNKGIGGIYGVVFTGIWLGLAVMGLYNDLTAKTGYFSDKTGQYVSVADRHMGIPIDILFVVVGIVFFVRAVKTIRR